MTPYYDDGVTTIYAGDSFDILPLAPHRLRLLRNGELAS